MNIFIDSNLIAKSKKDILFLSNEGKVSKKEIYQLEEQAFDAYNNRLYKKSLELNEKILRIKKKQLTDNHPEIANNLYDIGVLNFDLFQFKKARSFFLQAIEIYKLHKEKKYENMIVDSLGMIARTYQEEGNFKKALHFREESIEMFENSNSDDYELLSSLLNDLGLTYYEIGEYKNSKSALLKSIEIDRKSLSEKTNYESSRLAASLTNIGFVYTQTGEFLKAEESYLEAIQIYKEDYESEIEYLAEVKNNIGYLYKLQGFLNKAEENYLEGLKISEQMYGSRHPNIAISRNNLGELYSDKGLYEKAEVNYLEAIDILKEKYGSYHPTIGAVQNNLAANYKDQGLFKEARLTYEDALNNTETFYGVNHPQTAITLNNLGILYSEQKKFIKSEEYYLKSLKIKKKYFGNNHAKTFVTQSNLIKNYLNLKKNKEATKLAKNYFNKKLIYLQKELPFLTITDREGFKENFGANNLPYSFTSLSKEGINLALFFRLNNHGLLQEIEKRQSRIKSLDTKSITLINKLTQLTQQISSRNINTKKLKTLIIEREKLEKKLYGLMPEIKPRIYKVKEVMRYLPKNSALIEYKKYTPYLDNPSKKARYLALIIKSDDIQAIDLGYAELIDKKIKKAYKASISLPEFENQFNFAQTAWNELGNLIIYPLKNSISNVDTIFISPDGELNNVPFSALNSPNKDELLVDTFNLRLLTTGRQLITLSEKSRSSNNNNSIVFANPNFNKLQNKKDLISKSNYFDLIPQLRSKELNSKNWNPLRGTSKEGKEISKLIGASLFEGNRANVLNLQKQEGKKIIHIASHAFFLENKEKKIEDLMLRSGIVFSGANYPENNPNDDGYLMALEITRLNWEDTEMVVISACESGRGQILTGEGVYGLKRAISVAGAKSSLLSLWKVDDQATADFMVNFYKKLIAGQGRAEALTNTQRDFRNHKNKLYRHPYIWAAFQLSGDWRPIDF